MVIIGLINLVLGAGYYGVWLPGLELRNSGTVLISIRYSETKNFFSRQNLVPVLRETLLAYYPWWSDKLQ